MLYVVDKRIELALDVTAALAEFLLDKLAESRAEKTNEKESASNYVLILLAHLKQ